MHGWPSYVGEAYVSITPIGPGRSHPSPILNPYILGPEHNDITCLLLVGIRNDCSAPKNYTAKHKEQWSDSFWGIHKLIFSFFFLSNVTTIHDVIY